MAALGHRGGWATFPLACAYRVQFTMSTPEKNLVVREWQTWPIARSCMKWRKQKLEVLRAVQIGRVDVHSPHGGAKEQRRHGFVACGLRRHPHLLQLSKVGTIMQPTGVKAQVHWSYRRGIRFATAAATQLDRI